MESPAVAVFAAVYLLGEHRFEPGPLILLGLWQFHYLQRTFVYPFRMRAPGKAIPLAIVSSGAAFNTFNAVLNATWITAAWRLPDDSLAAPHWWIGAAIFLAGWALNVHSDSILRRLRGPGESGYRIPHGGAYRWVSCPNYLGEIVEWVGWAIATWSTAGLAFAVYTFANLFPRALSHHRWYREQFPDYPPERRAVLPYLV
jgi:protein-S-isoprenylcysteine O-methyltransferase Ste14